MLTFKAIFIEISNNNNNRFLLFDVLQMLFLRDCVCVSIYTHAFVCLLLLAQCHVDILMCVLRERNVSYVCHVGCLRAERIGEFVCVRSSIYKQHIPLERHVFVLIAFELFIIISSILQNMLKIFANCLFAFQCI
jgi:hypothetical protein